MKSWLEAVLVSQFLDWMTRRSEGKVKDVAKRRLYPQHLEVTCPFSLLSSSYLCPLYLIHSLHYILRSVVETP